ncbi:WD and tetratricopeptide repeats protein 1-like [Rhodnius prolixus]|uniref:WD and tetratricopeptide repeats protein 1-like n=1 Tax=Rhodnius prolixus TaxID=13249 RepID=UPI003D187D17
MSRKSSIPPFLGARELDSRLCLPLRRRLHVTRDFINRLTLVKELDGHLGCVNTLDWDAKGRIKLFISHTSYDKQHSRTVQLIGTEPLKELEDALTMILETQSVKIVF